MSGTACGPQAKTALMQKAATKVMKAKKKKK